jgi:mannose-6-phosphate isomerase-like protein (cupin superfamily)
MTALHAALKAAEALHRSTPELQEFAPWPDDLRDTDFTPHTIPATELVANCTAPDTEATRAFIEAIKALAPHAAWKRTYTEDEVGAEFLSRYGYFELYGPTGMARSDSARAYVGYWGENLVYDWHHHEAEALYFTLAGAATFMAENEDSAFVTPGQSRQHTSHQPHAMATGAGPILTYIVWRGPGMDGLPMMRVDE